MICTAAWCAFAAHAEPLHKPGAGKTIKVFILAGQSNAEGRADGELVTGEDRNRLNAAAERVQLAYNGEPVSGLRVVEPVPGIAKSYNRKLIFGPELFFGITLAELWPDERILLIKRTQGGTSLYGCWNPDWDAEKAAAMKEEDEPKLYEILTNDIREILSAYDPDEYELCPMLWVQGETDADNESAATAYGGNLERLIQSIREDTGREDLPFLMFQVGSGKVVEGMQRVARDVPNATLLPQSQDPDSPHFYDKMENGHYNYAGLKKLGRRFAETYVGLIN
jgi:hypothetical protein